MINCPNCRISFSPSFASCPRCQAFDTPLAARRSYLTQATKTRIDEGESPALVREDLLANGFSDLEADTLIGESVSSVRSETRRYGCRRFTIGVLMLGLAAFAIVIVLSGARIRGGFVITVIILLGSGSLATISGLCSLISGRESRTVGNIVDSVQGKQLED